METIKFDDQEYSLISKENNNGNINNTYLLKDQNIKNWKNLLDVNYFSNIKNINPETMINMYVESLGDRVSEKPNIFILKENEKDENSPNIVISNILLEDKTKNDGIMEFNVIKIVLENEHIKIYRYAIKINEYIKEEVFGFAEKLSKLITEIHSLHIPIIY